MLYDIDEFKRNPSIHFEYKYFVDETPTRFVDAITRVKGTDASENTDEQNDEENAEQEEKKGFPVIPILAAVAGAFVLWPCFYRRGCTAGIVRRLRHKGGNGSQSGLARIIGIFKTTRI